MGRFVPARGLSLAIVQRVLAEVEARQGIVIARRLAAALDYDQLVALARRGAAGEPHNRAALLDPRYLLLWGMRGEHVLAFQRALASLGFSGPLDGRYGDGTYAAYRGWLGTQGRASGGRADAQVARAATLHDQAQELCA